MGRRKRRGAALVINECEVRMTSETGRGRLGAVLKRVTAGSPEHAEEGREKEGNEDEGQ